MGLYDDLKKRVSAEWGKMGLWLVWVSLAVLLFFDWTPRTPCFAAMLVGGLGLIFSQPWGRLVAVGGLAALLLLHLFLSPSTQSLWYWWLGAGTILLCAYWIYDLDVGEERPEGFKGWVHPVEGSPSEVDGDSA